MAGRSCAETVLRGAGAGEVVTVTGNKLDVNATSTFNITTVPSGDASILQSTVTLVAGAITLVAAANASRRFIQINYNGGTSGSVAYLSTLNTVGTLTNYFQEMLDGGSFWLDNNVILGETFYMITADPLNGSVGVLEY